MNYFSLFNLPAAFTVDLVQLKQHYQTLQKMTHPDRFANASEQEKRMYLSKNAQINDAYQVLTSPVSRGEHLLSVRGFTLVGEQETVGDVNFLMQQMEWREDLEAANDIAALDALLASNAANLAAQEEKIAGLLKADTEQDNASAADELRKMKFLVKLASEIQAKIDAIEE
ncbi:Fe-S protein assembly co-chaperone HscB [Glaciecola sp. MH2013]|uniref:Fe-S protein assembly co-chaperone HscB n=1 Tax=Glaciecola sp. MH2013 TaxID=2785524 RepID=UPI00189E3A95|nr:Fe-S protein assembly co-chaperone HscB [Glaciecola sp. MH2013]MBF7074795.1 Fe-S protein assembly co-chaperone HscB [Glaciecola sp. MH2013]